MTFGIFFRGSFSFVFMNYWRFLNNKDEKKPTNILKSNIERWTWLFGTCTHIVFAFSQKRNLIMGLFINREWFHLFSTIKRFLLSRHSDEKLRKKMFQSTYIIDIISGLRCYFFSGVIFVYNQIRAVRLNIWMWEVRWDGKWFNFNDLFECKKLNCLATFYYFYVTMF